MASNGLLNRAAKGTCRICQRVRDTNKHLKAVGEVCHGYATGHIWECVDEKNCDEAVLLKLDKLPKTGVTYNKIKTALKQGRFKKYMVKL